MSDLVDTFESAAGELVGSMMELSSSMARFGARQLRAALGESASGEVVRASLRLLRQAPQAAGAALPGEAGRPWRELANKLEAFEHFQQVPALLGFCAGEGLALEELLRRASALGPYRSTWATEGLGYAYAESAWAAGESPRGLLSEERLAVVPERAVLALHTGAALSFAGRLLEAHGAASPADLERWLALWEANASPGYRDLLVEALGLVARNLAPHLLPGLAERLKVIDPVLPDYLWHGVGRGLYFVPTHALPWSGAHGRALDKARREPPDEGGRRNATAGLAWALALVNVRDPEILVDLLASHGGEIACPEAFAHGVASALVVWHDAVGHDAHLEAFLAHRPAEGGPALAARWDELVLAPCRQALRRAEERGRHDGALAALFRCPPPAGQGVSAP